MRRTPYLFSNLCGLIVRAQIPESYNTGSETSPTVSLGDENVPPSNLRAPSTSPEQSGDIDVDRTRRHLLESLTCEADSAHLPSITEKEETIPAVSRFRYLCPTMLISSSSRRHPPPPPTDANPSDSHSLSLKLTIPPTYEPSYPPLLRRASAQIHLSHSRNPTPLRRYRKPTRSRSRHLPLPARPSRNASSSPAQRSPAHARARSRKSPSQRAAQSR